MEIKRIFGDNLLTEQDDPAQPILPFWPRYKQLFSQSTWKKNLDFGLL